MARKEFTIFTSVIALVILGVALLILPPFGFPAAQSIKIPAGANVGEISKTLKDAKVIASARVFQLLVSRGGMEQSLQAGLYEFEKPLSVYQIIERLNGGIFALDPVKLTIPEGSSVAEAAELVHNRFPRIAVQNFINLAQNHEGYLFPDTYTLPPHVSVEHLVAEMRANFTRRLGPLKEQIEASDHSLDEIIKMASLVEEEASVDKDRRIIAGILWKRLGQGMMLQVDVEEKTYQSSGLPESPIVSPGLESIEAALEPTASPYLFYLSDKDGETHYARTFDEHKLNIDKYLK